MAADFIFFSIAIYVCITYINTMIQLDVKTLSKSFSDSQMVLDSINFSLPRGEFLVILGPSGCGKTTLLRIIAGLEMSDSGTITISGKDVTRLEPKYRDVAMVFQNYALYPHMTVYENLAFALKVRKFGKDAIRENVTRTAGLLGLTNYLDRRPAQLSGGQRQRVALGRAIVRNPSLFLFDEPLSNLDAELRSQMRFELLSLHRKLGATSLYVTHDQIEAMSLADNIIILNDGKQLGPARPRDLYENPPNIFVARFLGNPGMNLLKATVTADSDTILIGDSIAHKIGRKLVSQTEILYGFRPEHCAPSPEGDIPVEVAGVEDSGKEYILKLKGPDSSLLYCLSARAYNAGDKFKIKVNREHFFDSQSKALIG